MPKCFEFNGYYFYFYSNEFSGKKLEPIHVHFSKDYSTNAPKIWLMSDGTAKIDENDENKVSKRLIKLFEYIVSKNKDIICSMWINHFGEIEFKEI